MSAIATVSIVPISLLPELGQAAASGTYQKKLQEVSTSSSTFRFSGFVLVTLLPVLEANYGIRLMGSYRELAQNLSRACGDTQVLLTDAERASALVLLDTAKFSAEKLQKEYEEFNATPAKGIGEPMLGGIQFLRNALEIVSPETVAILKIG